MIIGAIYVAKYICDVANQNIKFQRVLGFRDDEKI
jgi:hypothetical protein